MKTKLFKKITVLLFGSLLAGSLCSCNFNDIFNTFLEGGEYTGGGSYVDPDVGEARYSFDITSLNFTSSYSTGNYGTTSVQNYTEENIYGYYRAIKDEGFITLLPLSYTFEGLTPEGGSFYNTTAISNIKKVDITFDTYDDSGSVKPYFEYGEQNYSYKTDLRFSPTESTMSLTSFKGQFNYFKICSGSTTLNIHKITITHVHKATKKGASFVAADAHAKSYRIAPHRFTGTPVAGETTVEAYVTFNKSNKSGTKRSYTYYTTEYIASHPELAEQAAMVEPIDVANYYSIFGVAPANFGSNRNDSTLRSLFDDKARQVSSYNRTDGYATSVPANASSGYVELDIALDSSYFSNRGVARIVGWTYGFHEASYGNGDQIVCVFTDDHYATFQEYNNAGEFLPRFNAEQSVTGKRWSLPSVVTGVNY